MELVVDVEDERLMLTREVYELAKRTVLVEDPKEELDFLLGLYSFTADVYAELRKKII